MLKFEKLVWILFNRFCPRMLHCSDLDLFKQTELKIIKFLPVETNRNMMMFAYEF